MIEPLLATLQQWVLFSGVVLTVGCCSWRTVVVPGAARMLGTEQAAALVGLERRVASVALTTVLVLLGAWVLRMVVQVIGFRDPFAPLWDDVSLLLFQTFWGTVWIGQGVVLGALALLLWRLRVGLASVGDSDRAQPRPSPAWLGATALALILVTTLAMSGHAMGASPWRPLIVASDAVHTLAAGSWIGSLAVILAVGRPARGAEADLGVYAAQITSFSPMAILSVGALISMGIALSWTHLTTVSDLWTMGYGRVLAAKIALAFTVFGAGFVNWRRGIPALGTADGARAVQRRAAWETALASGVLLLTAVLVHSTKP